MSKLRKYLKLYRLKGPGFTFRKALSVAASKVAKDTSSALFRFARPTFRQNLSGADSVAIREISASEYSIIAGEIRPSKRTFDLRMNQGARLFGAVWQGAVIDFYWAICAKHFREHGDGYDLLLKKDQCYFFDYMGIRRKRPHAFTGFRLMRALAAFVPGVFEAEEGRTLRFYSIVHVDNRNSIAFHKRYLQAEQIALIRSWRVLNINFVRAEDRRLLLDIP